MLTLLSDNEIHQIHSHMTEMAVAVENLTRILGGAQTVAFDVQQTTDIKPAKAAATAAPKQKSPSKTRWTQVRKGNALLSVRQVGEIKRLLGTGRSAAAIAREFKVHYSTINAIKWGKTWKHVEAANAKALEIVEIRK
jgi:DNA-binding NarL/FixJ family response regulator